MGGSTKTVMTKLHKWGAIAVSIPLIIVIVTGIVLQVRKPVDSIQPNIRYGVAKYQPVAPLAAVLESVRRVEAANVSGWRDIKLFDLRPKQGTVKVRTFDEFEIQVDAKTAEVLRTGQRWNDKLMKVHEGSVWGMRLNVFLIAAVITLLLSLTGTYLLCQETAEKLKARRRRLATIAAGEAPQIKTKRPFNFLQFCRRYHYVLAFFVVIPWLVVIASGLLLQVRYESQWVMPERLQGEARVPTLEFTEALDKAKLIPTAGVQEWKDVWRLYVYPNDGVVSIRAKNKKQIQFDAKTGELLDVSVRRTDLIEDIHEGKIFGANLWLFLPIHILSLVLWLLGVAIWLKDLLPTKPKRTRTEPAVAEPAE